VSCCAALLIQSAGIMLQEPVLASICVERHSSQAPLFRTVDDVPLPGWLFRPECWLLSGCSAG